MRRLHPVGKESLPVSKIKTKEITKGTIKVLDKSAIAAERMKEAFIRTKDKAEQGLYSDENSPTEYASDKFIHTTDRVADEGIHQFNKQGQNGFKKTQQTIVRAMEKIKTYKEQKVNNPAKQTSSSAKEPMKPKAQPTHSSINSVRQGLNHTIKTTNCSEKTIKYSTHSTEKAMKITGKGTIKTAQRSIKTAEKTTKATIKTTQKTAQTSAKVTKVATQTAKVAAKATVTTAKVVTKATIATVKTIISATKALASLIIAGGWMAAIIVVVICMFGMLVGSSFGIFFSGENSGSGMTIQTAIKEINSEYNECLEEIRNNTAHDILETSGNRAPWKEVLAIYSVKTITDPNGQDVATMDKSKKGLLKSFFWQMNSMDYHTESKDEKRVIESDDGYGSIIKTETTITKIYLYIQVSHKTSAEMADIYSFNIEQRKMLAELLSPKNDKLWSSILIGASGGSAISVSSEVQAYSSIIKEYAALYGISEYVELIKAVMMQESGGRGLDPMQASEGAFNTRYPQTPMGITDAKYSVACGVQEIKDSLTRANVESPSDLQRIKLALQGYNFGPGYISWASARGGYTPENAVEFAKMMAIEMGWSGYGDNQYVPHVLRYYSTENSADVTWMWPLIGYGTDWITCWYGDGGHNGMDIAAPEGTPIIASRSGTVISAEYHYSWGNNVYINHDSIYNTRYAHMTSVAVSPGEYVEKGQVIGYVGSTGNSYGYHLHFEVYQNGERIDPYQFIRDSPKS